MTSGKGRRYNMAVFKCSKCAHLLEDDISEKVFCGYGIMPVPAYRDASDRERCLESFEPIQTEKQWHEEFYWERG